MNIRQKNNLKRIGIFAVTLISILAGVFLLYRLAYFLLPFLIAFGISTLIEPIIRLLSNKLHIKRKIAAPIVLILIFAVIILLIILAVFKLVVELKTLALNAPAFLSELYSQIISWVNRGNEFIEWLPPEIRDNLGTFTADFGSIISNLSNTITSLGKTLLKGAFTTAISFPEALVFTIITIMATFFMTFDREKIGATFARHLPESWMQRIQAVKNDMFTALFSYLRAYLIIITITFTELFIGFSIIQVKFPLLLAFIIALIDALPVLGTGGVLIPWSVYSFVTGDFRMGMSILILYLVVLIIRQIVEPKVVGDQIGVYPLITLMSMYIGIKLMGLGGLILGPITFLLIRSILFTIYKNKTFKDIIGYESASKENP